MFARQCARLVVGRVRASRAFSAVVELPVNLKLAEMSVFAESSARHAVQRAAKETPVPLAYGVDIAVEVDSLFEEAATVDDVTQEAAAAADVTPRVEPVLFALPYSIFGEPLRVDILHQAVKWQRANARAVHRASKRRGEIRGSTRKIVRQKGTGGARRGSIRSPLLRGGAKAHGPTARDFEMGMNKQQRRLAMRVALSAKLREGRLSLVQDLQGLSPKTGPLHAAFKSRNWDRVLFVSNGDASTNFGHALGNIEGAHVVDQIGANVYDILKTKHVVLTTAAARALVARLEP